VQDILALAFKSRGSIGHHTFSLCSSNLAAEVRLAGFAELAFLAFWGAARSLLSVLFCRCRFLDAEIGRTRVL
jgi:hypothetical protein